MKKVLFTATVDSHILQFHLPYLKWFKDNGYEVHVATNGNESIPYCDKKHMVSFERSPYKINNLKAIKQLKKIIDEEKFDIIHCHTPMGGVVTRLAAKEARKNGTRVIYTAHGFHFYKGAPILNWLLFYPVEKYLAKYTDVLITINNEDYELARKKFIKTQVEYVPGVGVDPDEFNFEMTEEEKNRLRVEVGCNKDDFIIICVGELNKNKNQIMAIEAMKELVKYNKCIRLLIVGDGKNYNYYKDKVSELDLNSNIIFLGYRDDVNFLMKISNMAVSCSIREGLGLNIIEEQICKLPVVVTKNRGHLDIVKNEINGYMIEQESIKDLVKYVENIFENDKISNMFSKNNREEIKKFSINQIMKQIIEIYKCRCGI